MNKRKVLVLAGHTKIALISTRKELIERLLLEGYDVIIGAPFGEGTDQLSALGCQMEDVTLSRRGTNPVEDYKLFRLYYKLIQKHSPLVVLTFNVKSNIYGGFAAKMLKVPYVTNITGLGTAVGNGGLLGLFTINLYKSAMRNVSCLFFQNESNKQLFDKHHIAQGRGRMIPGSGVNLKRFRYIDYPDDEVVHFIFVGRLIKMKGVDEYLEAATLIKKEYPNTEFHVCGHIEEEYKGDLDSLIKEGIINFHGHVADVRMVLKDVHCLINPSYYPEGMSNVLLEASALGRVVIASRLPGCAETYDEGVTGYGIDVMNASSIVSAIKQFLSLSFLEKKEMGLAARKKIERQFDRKIVVDAYIDEISKIESVNKK